VRATAFRKSVYNRFPFFRSFPYCIDLKGKLWYIIVNRFISSRAYGGVLVQGDKLSSFAEFLTEERIQLLVSGLVSLEGALGALRQPIPPILGELKVALSQTEAPQQPFGEEITAEEAAALLKRSPRRVRQLGQERRIELAKQGERGRGHFNTYKTESVLAYRESANRDLTR
jgi:hypothetical protein